MTEKQTKKLIFFIIILSFFNSCSGQENKSINTDILDQEYNSLTKNKKVYNLRYHSYSDQLHTRIVLTKENIKPEWQPFTNGVTLDLIGLYFNESKEIIGLKSISDITEDQYRSILKLFGDRSNYTPIKLNNKDADLIENEWESKDHIIGIQYDKLNQSLSFMLINKDEIKKIYAEIFYTEFLNLTKNRIENMIKLPKLNYSSTEVEKNFYKEKFKELKNNHP